MSPAVGGAAGAGPDGPGKRGGAAKILNKAAKKRRRANIITAAAAVLVILAGGGVVAGTWFFDGVDLPAPKTENQTNKILDAKGQVLAKTGEDLTLVPIKNVNLYVQHAVAAAEDKNFYTHSGIDMKGIMRAAWNNFTGGSKQGASTITQQYARHAADLKDISYNRKLREAVIARKLESTYSKDEIMGFYLNYIYLGESRYGIEAAAQGYFGKSVLTPKDTKNAITPYEAAVLASIIKQPEPDPTTGHKGFDPNKNLPAAKDRWEYTMKNMLEMNWISPEQYAARKYPTVKPRSTESCKTCADGKPVGMIMRHVKQELAQMNISDSEYERGGLTIQTTIDPEVQKAAEDAARRSSKTSVMYKRPEKYQAAVIGVDPNTGRVLGYYGGDNSNGTDYASYLNGDGTGFSARGQSPGSTFKIYTLAAALRENISFDTVWNGKKKNARGETINNAGADPGKVCEGKIEYCDLQTATIQSYNFPFYQITQGIGVDKVLAAARDAGITHLWPDTAKYNESVDLTKTDPSNYKKNFDFEAGFGQYAVSPLEHAEGVATIVNGGVRHEVHFIKTVKRIDQSTGKLVNYKSEKLDGKRVFPEDQMSNLLGVMSKIPDHAKNTLRNGREAVAKSGTWEFDDGKDGTPGSGDTWFVGGIPQLAATVWVGNSGNKFELKEPASQGGGSMFGSGSPAQIWEDFINAVTKAKDMKQEDFPPRQKTGDDNSQYQTGEKPPPPPPPPVVTPPEPTNQNPVCNLFPDRCQNGQPIDTGQNNGGGGNNNGGNNNGGGGNNNGGNNNGGGGNNNGGTINFPGNGNQNNTEENDGN
ncbi:transglycosylase domain-containing protein [Actinoplanes sp. N902-109]|uniref:transglycosylase domain-containing protein n=1 Tax=Actinoplanes sp. (strain N902-109) TaxID=649831 RepID=UPI000329440E|nr:transglycosylase domain-containing protein [Actinoplanes sp. N902-109]AGL21696.1 peptidoglycan glycosyltransferase [Actinoplanes sp. N902-109]